MIKRRYWRRRTFFQDEWERRVCFPYSDFGPFAFVPFFLFCWPVCCGLLGFWKPWRHLSLKTIVQDLTHNLSRVKNILLIFFVFASPNIRAETILLAIGQLREIKVPNLSHYSVGNDSAVSHKHLVKKKVLIFKGKRLGYSEVIVWSKGKKRSKYRFYVIDRRRHLKILHLVEALNSVGLKVRLSGPLVVAGGTIQNHNVHRLIKKLVSKNADDIHLTAVFSKSYRHQLLGQIYKHLYDEYIDNFRCQIDGINILCRHPAGAGPSKKLKEFLVSNYFLTFIPIKRRGIKNYRFKMKLVQMEKLDGGEFNFGLDRLEGGLLDLFNEGVTGILKKNKIFFNRYKIDFTTLAEPQAIFRIGHPVHLKVGTEIPYENGEKEVFWKFAGLEIKLELKEGKRGFQIFYSTKLSSLGGSKNIVGNNESSSALIKVGQPLKLFDIIFRTIGERESALPSLQKIPLLGNIFRSKSNNSNLKNITAVILLEELDDNASYSKGF